MLKIKSLDKKQLADLAPRNQMRIFSSIKQQVGAWCFFKAKV
jgi:hypothetical protein